MTFQQTKLPLVLAACGMGSITALFLFSTFMVMIGRNLGLALLLLPFSALVSLLFLRAVVLAWHPIQLDVDDRGITIRRRRRSETWAWPQVSSFSFFDIQTATSIRFDAEGPEGQRKRALPANWPGGAMLMIARLNAARTQYTDPSWSGQPWQEVTAPKERHVLMFVVGAGAGLLVFLVFGLIGLARLKH